MLALSYLGVAAGLLACAKLPALTFTSAAAEVPHGAAVEAAE